MADAKIVGREKYLARLAKIPAAARDAANEGLDGAAERMKAALQRAAPVAPEFERHPGELRDEIEIYQVDDRELSRRIMSTARDGEGTLYGPFVEFGHGDAAPRPWWWPTYRAQKKPIRARMYARLRKVVKTLFPES